MERSQGQPLSDWRSDVPPERGSGGADRFSLLELPIRDGFAEAVHAGLGQRPRRIPPRFFYDGPGSELFERICALPEYYVTRTEYAILERHAGEIVAPEHVIELGCGYGAKTRLLFEAFFRARRQMTFVPVDISGRALVETGRRLTEAYPGIRVRAIRAEFERAIPLLPPAPALILFLGSNIGNLDRAESIRFLSALRGYHVLVGFDMHKEPGVLQAAYSDAQGITAQFNLNLLARINRELGGNFDLARWRHVAFYDAHAGRVEMHLASDAIQAVRIGGRRYLFEAGERIHTENSYKFTDQQIRGIAAESGFHIEKSWTDDRGWFSVVLLT
jgi:L-histidine Nalpha-methyltransferase